MFFFFLIQIQRKGRIVNRDQEEQIKQGKPYMQVIEIDDDPSITSFQTNFNFCELRFRYDGSNNIVHNSKSDELFQLLIEHDDIAVVLIYSTLYDCIYVLCNC